MIEEIEQPEARRKQFPRFQINSICKDFGSNRVLRGIDLTLSASEVTVFMGANGAGKSTLVKIIAGVYPASEGTMSLDGAPYVPHSPSDALRRGIVVVHQAINDNIVLSMDVLENLMIDRLCQGGSPWFGRRRLRGEAQAMLDRIGLAIPLDTEMADLSLADRQMVAIARALAHDPKLLILDEPTSALSNLEAERLFGVIETLRARGVPVLYISHRMGDIRRLADRIVTLRDGRITGDFNAPLDYEAAVGAMLGQALEGANHARAAAGETIVTVDGLQLEAAGPRIDLTLNRGEVTAVVGLIGAGKSEVGECLYGVRRPASGTMAVGGIGYSPQSPGDAVAAGVYMAAEDRAGGSLVQGFDLSQNITLPFLGAFTALGLMRRGAEKSHARGQIARLGIVAQGPGALIETLSGGNQQKVVLARWLSKPCRLLILDEPFQGVDIAARRDIGTALRETAKDRATLVLCADLDEAIEVADRIVVMAHHGIVGEHTIDRLDREAIVRDMSAMPLSSPAPRSQDHAVIHAR
ncbi:MAG: sugar ABC transporter ATP-binding protein [Pseudomonadota bacterium]